MKRPAILAVLVLAAPIAASWAQDAKHPARLMPPSALAYWEITQPEKLIDVATNPRLWEVLKQNDQVQKYFRSEQYTQLLDAVKLFEDRLSVKWQPAVRDLVGGGIYVAADPAAGAGVLIVKPKKPELLTKLHKTIVELMEDEGNTPKSREYGGVTGWSFGPKEAHTIVGGMLIVSNQADAVKAAVDRHNGDKRDSLAAAADFKQAQAAVPAGRVGWGIARVAPLRLIPGVTAALDRRHNNPAAELLGAGVAEALKQTSVVTFSLHIDDGRFSVRAQLPLDASKVAEKRKWFFSAEPGKSAYAPLMPKGTILSISTYRDISGMWLKRDELFNEETVAGLSQADTALGLYFSGRDFGTEVLGAVTPRLQIVVTRQQYAKDQPVPSLKIPAFALVLEMKKPDDFSKQLLLGYQKIIGIINITGGMNGQPQLLIDSEEHNGVKISRTQYLVEPGTDKKAAPLNFNFSPSAARVGDRFILSSTVGLARDLVDELKKTSSRQITGENTAVVVGMPHLADALGDNKELLITQNVLSEGNTREQATEQIELLLNVLRAVRGASLRLATEKDQLVLEGAVEVPER